MSKRRHAIRSYAPSELRSDYGLAMFSLAELVKAWPFLPHDIQYAILSIVQCTVRKPKKIEALNLEIKRLYLELSQDREHFPRQAAIIKEIMKRTGIASRSTVMKHLAAIRRFDETFPRKNGPKTRKPKSD